MPIILTCIRINDNLLIEGDHISFKVKGVLNHSYVEMIKKVKYDSFVKSEVMRGLESQLRFSGWDEHDLQRIWDELDAHLKAALPISKIVS